MSYFVGHKAVKDGHKEDGGFAINGGKGWADVVFDNHQIEVNGNTAIAMGNYYFTSCADGSKTKVEYTFGYKKNADGNVRIFLHHSSVPFTSAQLTSSNTISENDVQKAQAAWASAIKKISKTYLDGGGCSQIIHMQSQIAAPSRAFYNNYDYIYIYMNHG